MKRLVLRGWGFVGLLMGHGLNWFEVWLI